MSRSMIQDTRQTRTPGRALAKAGGGKAAPVAASKAKAGFLGIIDQVHSERRPVLVSRRGKPIVQIAPLAADSSGDPFGCLKGTVKTHGDVVRSEPDHWDALA